MASRNLIRDFLLNDMRMSHVYQPLIIKELVLLGGFATLEELAKALAPYDLSQVEYYTQIIKRWPRETLTKHGIVKTIKDGSRILGFQLLHADGLSHGQREGIVKLCKAKINEIVSQRGLELWAYRQLSAGNITGSMRFDVLKRARTRCELCGVSAKIKMLHVDHIVPRSLGGSDDISNFQALCETCNTSKRDRDDTDFRRVAQSYGFRSEGCPLCELDHGKVIDKNELCFAASQGSGNRRRVIVAPHRHVSESFIMHQPEINAAMELLRTQRQLIMDKDSGVSRCLMRERVVQASRGAEPHCHFLLVPVRNAHGAGAPARRRRARPSRPPFQTPDGSEPPLV